MKIVERKIEQLQPYENNPRKNEDAVEYVANSIREFGWQVPIVIDNDNTIVAGHTRYLAAQKLGIDVIPCVVADDLSEEQIKAFRLADNKVSEVAGWDFSMLADELDALDIDMEMFGFDSNINDYIDGFFEQEDEETSGKDEPEKAVVTITCKVSELDDLKEQLEDGGWTYKVK